MRGIRKPRRPGSNIAALLNDKSNKNAGPRVQVTRRVTCSGCQYFKSSMKMRSMRATEDYWDCAHPDVMEMKNARMPNGTIKPMNTCKSIGSGSGLPSTPGWCPYLKNVNKER